MSGVQKGKRHDYSFYNKLIVLSKLYKHLNGRGNNAV